MSNARTVQLTLKTNLANSAMAAGMKDGRIKSDLVKLDFCGPAMAHDGFKAMVRDNAFEAGELAIVTYLQAKAYGKPYIMLPAPTAGRFLHQFIAFNRSTGRLDPKEIEGKRVGVRMYAQTTGMWVRGILQHEYGVDLNKVTWCTSEESHLKEYSDPVNCMKLPKGSSIAQMMLDGDLAAAILGYDMPTDPCVSPLIPDPLNAAKQWHARERVVPINHVFVVHQDIAKKHPEVVREIWRMIVESRALAPASAMEDFPSLGLEANRKSLEMAIAWAHEQKLIPHKMSVDELYDETSAALG